MACQCVIQEILITSFESKPFQEQLELIKKGRPVPELSNLFAEYKDKKRSYTRHFQATNYEKTAWLTGCLKLNKLFCWPCLLFSEQKSVWSSGGFCNLNNLCKAVGRHEITRAHIDCFFKLQTFGDCNDRTDPQLDHRRAVEVTNHNDQVKKNRHILSCLINAVFFLAKQELDFCGHGEVDVSQIKGNYIELLNYTAQYDAQLEGHLKTSSTFRGSSLQIQSDLIGAISSVLNDSIREELNKAGFVSILLDETSDIANKSQLSICFRFVDEKGEIQERFLKFTDASACQTSGELFELVDKEISEYNLSNKIVGQTYDGTPVMSEGDVGLQAKIGEKYPEALFVHCYSHSLNLVLEQSVSNINECDNFFKTLSGISSFVSKSPKRTALSLFMKKKLPKLAPTTWNFTSRLVITVKENRAHLIDFFESIVDNSSEWDSESVLLARGGVSFLNNLRACFLLETFSSIFSYTEILFDVLQDKSFDTAYCCQKIEDVTNAIKKIRQNTFDDIWENVYENSTEHPPKRRNEDPAIFYKSLFYEILDNILVQLTDRFGNYKNLAFKTLLDTEKFPQMTEKFPEAEFNCLLQTYNRYFDSPRLRNELIVLYSMAATGNEMSDKPLNLMLQYMIEKKLNLVMPEIYKLLLIIFTLPATTAESTFSASKRIKMFTRSTQGQKRLFGLALLSIEKCLLQTLRQDPKYKFEEAIIEKFCAQTRRMEFIFK